MRQRLYTHHGINVWDRRGAESARHSEPAVVLGTRRWRDRARASALSAVGLQASARAARGRVRGIESRSPAAVVSTPTGAAHGARCLDRAVPPPLVEARRWPEAIPGQDG